MSPAVRSPVAGVVVALDDVPDPVFSGRIVAQIKAGGLNPIVSVIALEGKESALAPVPTGQRVAAGDPLMTWA